MGRFRKVIGKRNHFSWALKEISVWYCRAGSGKEMPREGTCVSHGTKARMWCPKYGTKGKAPNVGTIVSCYLTEDELWEEPSTAGGFSGKLG